jgi:hypothetical protein
MKSYVTFRRHSFDAVVARTNEDRHPLEVVPYGRFGAGLWTGHPIGLVIVTGLVVIGLVGIPAWRWLFGATVILGSLFGYSLWRRQQ